MHTYHCCILPEIGTNGCADAVALGVEVSAHSHRVTWLLLIDVLNRRRLSQERVTTTQLGDVINVSVSPLAVPYIRPMSTCYRVTCVTYFPLDSRTLLMPSALEATKTLGSADCMNDHMRSYTGIDDVCPRENKTN